MTQQSISAAMDRVSAILQRRPDVGLHDDPTATARWQHDLRVETDDGSGARVLTDMPSELGGSGDLASPGWLLRAGLAACAATRIAMAAAAERIELTTLEVTATSRSDVRGLLGMADADGAPIACGPRDMQLRVRVVAPGTAPERLRALVESSHRHSPVSSALSQALSIQLHIDTETA